jgi:hypothetical protein
LGLAEHKHVTTDTVDTSKDIDMDTIVKLECDMYLRMRNRVVTSFLSGIANMSEEEPTKQNTEQIEIYKLCKTIESVMNLSVTKTVLPLHFRESLIEFSLTTAS